MSEAVQQTFNALGRLFAAQKLEDDILSELDYLWRKKCNTEDRATIDAVTKQIAEGELSKEQFSEQYANKP